VPANHPDELQTGEDQRVKCHRWPLSAYEAMRYCRMELITALSRFFVLRVTVEPKIPGAVIPRRVFTQPWPLSDIAHLIGAR
jgi:hypothetical protein